MSTALTPLLNKFAQRYEMGATPAEVANTLKQTCFKGQVSDAQMVALLIVECQTCALDHGLVSQHALRGRLPRLGVALTLGHVLGNAGRVFAVFPVDPACVLAAISWHLEIHAVELRMLVDDARPAVQAYHWNDPVVLVREGVQFLREWVQCKRNTQP